MTKIPQEQVDRFRAELEPAVLEVCPAYGLDPAECVTEAIVVSACGKYAVGKNFWNLTGVGSRGCYWALVAPRTHNGQHGGVEPHVEQRAKYGSTHEAVDAWCRARGAT
jgi:hypothetical protein